MAAKSKAMLHHMRHILSRRSHGATLEHCRRSNHYFGPESKPRGPELQVHPKSSLNDELLDIRATGLIPEQTVQFKAHVFTERNRYRFVSNAYYVADRQGNVKVQTDPSVGGSYTGVEPMGLIWSMEPSPEVASQWPRLVKKNVLEPFVYHISLLDVEGRELGCVSAERWFLAKYVERTLVSHKKAEGCLYLPKRNGHSDPMPVLIDIRGGVRFLVEDRPALLASHGIATFSVNYFRKMMQDGEIFDSKLVHFDMQIFLDIFDFIKHHPHLDADRVGIVSSCLGSTLSLNAAAHLKGLPIRCIAATGCVDILPSFIGFRLPDGTEIDPMRDFGIGGEMHNLEDGVCLFQKVEEHYDVPDAKYRIPVEEISVPMLFLIPEDDQYIASAKCMKRMIKRIERAGNGHLLDVTFLEGAGHFVDAPYLPLCKRSNLTPHLDVDVFATYGRDPKLHAYAQETAWKKTINWFRRLLGVTEMHREDWLD